MSQVQLRRFLIAVANALGLTIQQELPLRANELSE
jgi:hypothetical protein